MESFWARYGIVCDYMEVIMAITCQESRCHYLLTEGTGEEVTNRKLSLYFLRDRIIIHLNCQDLFQAASVQEREGQSISPHHAITVIRKAIKTGFLKALHN